MYKPMYPPPQSLQKVPSRISGVSPTLMPNPEPPLICFLSPELRFVFSSRVSHEWSHTACRCLHLASFALHNVSGFLPPMAWPAQCSVLLSLLRSIPLYEYARCSAVDGHLGCFLETFLSHCRGRSDLSSWSPRSPQGVDGQGGRG